MAELAKLVTLEQGKTLADAEGDVLRGLRKFCCLLLCFVHMCTDVSFCCAFGFV